MSSRNIHDHNGEPGCETLEELNQMYRNFWDPTTYWKCDHQGQPAKLHRCPVSELFYDKEGKCVKYREWEISDPIEPVSRPKIAKSQKL